MTKLYFVLVVFFSFSVYAETSLQIDIQRTKLAKGISEATAPTLHTVQCSSIHKDYPVVGPSLALVKNGNKYVAGENHINFAKGVKILFQPTTDKTMGYVVLKSASGEEKELSRGVLNPMQSQIISADKALAKCTYTNSPSALLTHYENILVSKTAPIVRDVK